MSSFDGYNFKVFLVDENWFPNPVRDSDGVVRYSADILIPNTAAYEAFQDRVSIVTTKRPLGSMAVNVHVEGGPGQLSLTVPLRRKESRTYNAILVSLDPRGTAWYDTGMHRATAEWIITSDVTP